MSQSTYFANNLVHTISVIDDRVFAPTAFERIFNTLNGQEPTPAPAPVRATNFVFPAAVIGTGATAGASQVEVLAVKTAQLVAERLAHETLDAMAYLDSEFEPDAYVRQAGRAVAEMMVPSLQALSKARRVEVAARAADPVSADEGLDVVLDSVGRMLSVYSEYLPVRQWVPMALGPEVVMDARVLAWRGPDSQVVFDLIDTFGPRDDACSGRTTGSPGATTDVDVSDEDPSRHHDEVNDAICLGRGLFGSDFMAVRYLPTFRMRHARVTYANGSWDPFGKTALPALRLIK